MMNRITRRQLAVALSLATALTAGSGTASATMIDPGRAGIDLWTSAYFAGDVLTITADGEFRTNNAENTTLALQAVGTETWVDSAGITRVTPLSAAPVTIAFGRTNHVQAVFNLHENSVVEVTYTAQHVGLAPSPFMGSCLGAAVRTSTTNTFTTRDC